MKDAEPANIFIQIFRSKLIFVLIASLFFLFIAIGALRANYSKMVELREAVYAADRENGDTETALKDLRAHVHGHMNTNLTSGSNPIKPPIQLKGRYERLVAVEQERVKAENAKVAARGETICASRYPAGGFNSQRVACVQEYVSVNAVKESSVAEDLYKFDFVSPKWSPDAAGLSLAASVILGVWFIAGLAWKIVKQRISTLL